MQESMFTIPIPPLLAIGFLIGILLLVMGYRIKSDLIKRHHQMGLGTVIIGIMIPITPLSWYGYWALTSIVLLGIIDIAIIVVTLIIGIVLVYKGIKFYSSAQ